MIQPATWKSIVDILKSGWNAVGPLIGVMVGALLARSWDRRKWMNDNRKEECRELLTAMTKVADSCLETRAQMGSVGKPNVATVQAAWAEERRCMIILQDRIFIAKRLREAKMFKLWTDTTKEFLQGGDTHKFGEKLNKIKATIIDIAING